MTGSTVLPISGAPHLSLPFGKCATGVLPLINYGSTIRPLGPPLDPSILNPRS